MDCLVYLSEINGQKDMFATNVVITNNARVKTL